MQQSRVRRNHFCTSEDVKLEGASHTWDIVYNDSNRGVSDIARNQTPESFLSSCIPAWQVLQWTWTLQLEHACHKRKALAYHNCRRTVLSSRYMVLDKKSIPIVACNCTLCQQSNQNMSECWYKAQRHCIPLHLICIVKLVIHKPGDDTGLAYWLISQENLQQQPTQRSLNLGKYMGCVSIDWLTNLYFASGDTVDPLAMAA